MAGRTIALVSLSAVDLPVIEAHVARIAAAVDDATTGSVTHVECGKFARGLR
jgi:hypothetical protein